MPVAFIVFVSPFNLGAGIVRAASVCILPDSDLHWTQCKPFNNVCRLCVHVVSFRLVFDRFKAGLVGRHKPGGSPLATPRLTATEGRKTKGEKGGETPGGGREGGGGHFTFFLPNPQFSIMT